MDPFTIVLLIVAVVELIVIGYLTSVRDDLSCRCKRLQAERDRSIHDHGYRYEKWLELQDLICKRAEQDLRACGRLSEEKRVV